MPDTCRTVDVDGTSVTVRGNGRPLTARDIDTLRVMRAKLAATPKPAQDGTGT